MCAAAAPPANDRVNCVNSLPTELLCNVFDQLCFKDQLVAMTACSRWHEILSDPQYLKQRALRLPSYNVNEEDNADYKRYPVVILRAKCERTLEVAKTFLYDADVAANIEELHLEGPEKALTQLFSDDRELHLPKLRVLTMSELHRNFPKKINLVAPNLKCIKIDSHIIFYRGDLAEQFLDQIEELSFTHWSAENSLLEDHSKSYKNLRRLILRSLQYRFSKPTLPDYPSRLTYLNLRSFNSTAHILLPLTTNLQSLHLEVASLDPRCLLHLKHLKEFSFCGSFLEGLDNICVTFPNLARLKVDDIRHAPNFISENLQMLEVTRRTLIDNREKMQAFFQNIRQTLRAIGIGSPRAFVTTSINSFLIDQICTLTHLYDLRIESVIIQNSDVYRIMEAARIRRAAFLWCEVRREGDEESYLTVEECVEFYAALRARFVDCAIITEDTT